MEKKNKPVSKHVRKSLPILKLIARDSNPQFRSLLLKKLDGDLTVFDAMSEISKNYLNKNINVNPIHSKVLSRTKNVKSLKNFLCPTIRKDCKKRSKALIQSGGYIQFLIPAAVALITSLLSK